MYSMSSLRPAIHPPIDARDLDMVPIQMSTLRASISKCSRMPQPVAPIVPKLWASSTINIAP